MNNFKFNWKKRVYTVSKMCDGYYELMEVMKDFSTAESYVTDVLNAVFDSEDEGGIKFTKSDEEYFAIQFHYLLEREEQ